MGLNRYVPPMPPLSRREGWEGRLVAVVKAASTVPYVLGKHDCLRVAMQAVEALTGHDHWPHLAGRYATREQAVTLILDHGETFDVGFNYLFGVPLRSMYLAARGDIAKYVDAEPHLGVVLGAEVAVLKADGLAYVPRSACAGCWRIG